MAQVQAPQRRNRGTRINTAPKVSAMPKQMAAGRLRNSGMRAWAMRTAAPGASVIFHKPDARNRTAVATAPIQLATVFQPDSSSEAMPESGCAILSFMDVILDPFTEALREAGEGGPDAF